MFGYGHDEYTRRVEGLVAEQFGEGSQAFFVWGGSGANVLALRAMARPWQAVICADTAHLNVDECGAPEAIAGVKLLAVPGKNGKLTPELVEGRLERVGDEHAVQPRLVSISQCTELGTLYTVSELRELGQVVRERGLLLHMDGARLSNAAAALGVPLRALTRELGVDALSFGGTKNGLLGAEAVVFLDATLAEGFEYLRKQTCQLASKMRFLAAQFEALISEELWLRCATHANAMAAKLAAAIEGMPGVRINRPVETNAVFAILPAEAREQLREKFDFYVWDESTGEVRWMCSWDTTEDDVERFAAALRAAVA